jgi:predicted HicB family RNase H-like nuclease
MTQPTNGELIRQAEAGYDVDEILRRRGGQSRMNAAPSALGSLRLSPELKRDLLLRAAHDGVSFSEVIRTALEMYVRAR